jgi:hypothetical protein
MKKIDVEDKFQIKQLLYANCVLGVKENCYRSFGGFQLWWYDKQHDICSCCASGWSDFRKKVTHHSLDEAAKILWRSRNSLFLRDKRLSEDKKFVNTGHLAAKIMN